MFERLRQSIREAFAGGSTPAAVAMMRDALVEAKVAVSQSREARDATAAQLAHEQAELATVRRRGQLAAQINDTETVAVAARFEQKHTGRVEVLARKLAALEAEVALGERELDEMSTQFREMAAKAGAPAPPSAPMARAGMDEAETEHNSLRRAAERSAREADASQRLEELKRKMGR